MDLKIFGANFSINCSVQVLGACTNIKVAIHKDSTKLETISAINIAR